MHGRRLGISAGLFFLALCGSPIVMRPLAAQESCQSAQCHATLVQGNAVHEAAESCDNCHAATATPHPQQGQKTFKLLDAQPALCYRCHERTSILADRSFATRAFRTTPSGGGHSGHLAAGAPCSACHDPHGVSASGNEAFQPTGDHTHLINFDTNIVAPVESATFPVFKDTGSRSGSCTLVCHGVTHTATSYP